MNKALQLECLDLSLITGFPMRRGEKLGLKYYGAENVKRLHTLYDPLIANSQITFFEDKGTDTQGLFYEKESTLYIVFRGSESKTDWARNLLYKKMIVPFDRQGKKDKIHTGFLTNYMSVRKLILDIIIKKSPTRVIVSGHSLGGALATICALDIQYNFRSLLVTLCALAPPRVGNRHYRKGFQKIMKEAELIMVRGDPIPHLPPWLFGYVHVLPKTKIGKRKVGYKVTDHFPSVYRENILA